MEAVFTEDKIILLGIYPLKEWAIDKKEFLRRSRSLASTTWEADESEYTLIDGFSGTVRVSIHQGRDVTVRYKDDTLPDYTHYSNLLLPKEVTDWLKTRLMVDYLDGELRWIDDTGNTTRLEVLKVHPPRVSFGADGAVVDFTGGIQARVYGGPYREVTMYKDGSPVYCSTDAAGWILALIENQEEKE